MQLAVKDEEALKVLIRKLHRSQCCFTVFREPDIGNEITAIAIEPSASKLVKGIKLLFQKETENESQKSSNSGIAEDNGN